MDKMNFTTNRANGPKQEWYEAHTFTKGSWERMNITGTEKRRRNNIQYLLAYQPIFDVIHVNDAERGNRYLCLGCDQEMIPRKGRIKKHHFAHKADLEQCNPDNALHETAKAAICQGFLTALEDYKSYPVKFPCDRCRKPIPVNVAVEGAGIATERTAIKGTRSDLVITKDDGRSPRVIIEIVVHHDLDVDTEEKYKGSGIAVIKIRTDLGNRFIRWENGELRWHNPETGQHIMTFEQERDRAEAAETRADAAEARIRELEAELARRNKES